MGSWNNTMFRVIEQTGERRRVVLAFSNFENPDIDLMVASVAIFLDKHRQLFEEHAINDMAVVPRVFDWTAAGMTKGEPPVLRPI